jgi:hypothetical protein
MQRIVPLVPQWTKPQLLVTAATQNLQVRRALAVYRYDQTLSCAHGFVDRPPVKFLGLVLSLPAHRSIRTQAARGHHALNSICGRSLSAFGHPRGVSGGQHEVV